MLVVALLQPDFGSESFNEFTKWYTPTAFKIYIQQMWRPFLTDIQEGEEKSGGRDEHPFANMLERLFFLGCPDMTLYGRLHRSHNRPLLWRVVCRQYLSY